MGERKRVRAWLLGAGLYAAALIMMAVSSHWGLQRAAVQIATSDGKPCVGTIWRAVGPPKGVMLIGHGVSSNEGMMAGIGKAYADAGYAAVTIDYWGHGRARERFDWMSNMGQLLAWCEWAKKEYPGLPLGYLGHSMGGFAGAELFADNPAASAFVAMGAYPRRFSAVKTLIAAGRYEELFNADEAAGNAQGKADVLVSPYSDHALEPLDPILIQGMIAWTDKALGLPESGHYAWSRWALVLAGTVLGCFGAFPVAGAASGLVSNSSRAAEVREVTRRWSVNPYRIAGAALHCRGEGDAPRAASLFLALVSATIYSGALVLALSFLLSTDVFTNDLTHVERCLGWAVLTVAFLVPFLIDAIALERLPLGHSWKRFAVAAITRAAPLLVLSVVMRLAGHGLAFGGMMMAILAFVAVMLSIVYTLATRSSGDYRAGAFASSVVLAWVIAFWFPLFW